MMLPFLDSELLPADPWGRCQERLTLVLPTGIRVDLGDHDQTFVISEHGLTKGEPLMSAYRAEWQGEGDDHAKRWLRITLADGREFDARACCLSLAPGTGRSVRWRRRSGNGRRSRWRRRPRLHRHSKDWTCDLQTTRTARHPCPR